MGAEISPAPARPGGEYPEDPVAGGAGIKHVPVNLAAGRGVGIGLRMLQCCLSEKLQTQGTRCFHMLSGDFSGGVAVLLFDGMYQGLVLVQGFGPAVSR
jgi:hypothetical protein